MSGALASLMTGGLSSLLSPIIDTLTDNLDPIKKEQVKAQIALQLQQADNALLQSQTTIDAAEAANPSMFVAGWRPAIGWVCALAYLCAYVIQPIFTWAGQICGYRGPAFPKMDLSDLTPLLIGMLGLAAYRTAEKIKGVPDTQIGKGK